MRQGNKFACLIISVVSLIIYTGINNLVYNWIYLTKVYDKQIEKWSFVNFEVLKGYWNWIPGKILCIANILLIGFIIYLWIEIKKSPIEADDSKSPLIDQNGREG